MTKVKFFEEELGFLKMKVQFLAVVASVTVLLLTSSYAQDASCNKELAVGEVFQCNVVDEFNFNRDAEISRVDPPLNGAIEESNENTIKFTPEPGFSGKQKISFTIKDSDENEHPKSIVLNYSSTMQNLLAPGQVTALGTLFVMLLFLAIVLEFSLRAIFQWRWFVLLFEGRGIKFLVSLVVAFMLIWAVGLNLVEAFSSATGNDTVRSPVLGPILTALIVAGGSATVLQLWKTFNFLPDPAISETGVKKKDFSRIKVVVDREAMTADQKKQPLEVFIDGDLVGSIAPNNSQFPSQNVLWSGHPVEARDHTYEVVYGTGTAGELRWQRRHGVPEQRVQSSILHFRLDPNEVAPSQTGNILTLTAPSTLKAGEPFKVGSIMAIASTDAEAGHDVRGFITGVYDVPKVPDTTIAQGEKLYWDDTNKYFTKDSTGNTFGGAAVAAAASANATVRLRLS